LLYTWHPFARDEIKKSKLGLQIEILQYESYYMINPNHISTLPFVLVDFRI